MNPGDVVQLPDGRTGYFQTKNKDGTADVLVRITVPATDAKKLKAVR
jgi:hypothetical protein